MNEKRFRVQEHCLRSSYGIEAENWLVTNDNHSVVLNNKAEAHMVANMGNDVINKLNELTEKNNELKEKIQLLQGELNADAKQYKIFIDIINEADDLIKSHLSKHYQRKWKTICQKRGFDIE